MADQLATPEDLAALLQDSQVDRATAELLLECATAVVQSAAGGQRILQVVDDAVTLYLDGLRRHLVADPAAAPHHRGVRRFDRRHRSHGLDAAAEP
jgi:hypothetical protein